MIKSGIYIIKNIINGKFYIGSSNNIKLRWNNHLSSLKRGEHHTIMLQRAWDKYGESAFQFEIAEEVTDESKLLTIEQNYLDLIKNSIFRVYNTNSIASKPPSHKGLKRSQDTKNKMSRAMIGKKHLVKQGRDINIYNFKNRVSNEIFVGTKWEFRQITGIKSSNLSKLINRHKNYTHCQNWILI